MLATGVLAPTTQGNLLMVFVISVTAPLRASIRPSTVAPALRLMLVSAITVPRNLEPAPIVAELVTCQKTLQDEAPLMRLTRLPGPVMRVAADLKMKTALGSPAASSVSVPVRPSVPPE